MIFPYLITPWLPTNCDLPPTLYSLLDSICNFEKYPKTNIYNLAKVGRSQIFDFTYPLSDKVDKEEFETMILNHFMMRRIGFETPTAFKLALNVKMNEIMPRYNKLFDSFIDWDIFNNGETISRLTTDNGNNNVTNNIDTLNTSDRRNSQMPQNEIEDVKDGNYMTDYNYDTNSGNSSSTTNSTVNNTTDELIKKSPSDKLKIYKEMLDTKNNIYTMIFRDLDSLFYGLV